MLLPTHDWKQQAQRLSNFTKVLRAEIHLDYTQSEPMELPSPISSHIGSVSTHHENSSEKKNTYTVIQITGATAHMFHSILKKLS